MPLSESPFLIEAGENLVVDGRVKVGGTISGHLARVDGSALDGPLVFVYATQHNGNGKVNIATGDWYVWGLHPDTYRVHFSDADQEHWVSEFWEGSRRDVDATQIAIADGQIVTDVSAVLERWATISGTVLRQTGSGPPVPAANALVSVEIGTGFPLTAYTDASGHYTLAKVAPGSYPVSFNDSVSRFEWWNDAHELSSADLVTVTDGQNRTGVDAVLEQAGSIVGAVDDGRAAGIPYTDIWVNVYTYDEVTGQSIGVTGATVQPDGKFVVNQLPPGEYRVGVRHSDSYKIGFQFFPGVHYIGDAQEVTVVAGGVTDLGTMELIFRPIHFQRLGGADRFATVVKGTQLAFPGTDVGLPVVYIANGMNYPDALSAGPAAGHEGGALLTVTVDAIPPVILAELNRLDPERIVVVGGTGSVSEAVMDQLRAGVPSATTFDRVAGASRYETSRKIVEYAFGGEAVPMALIATGSNFPDALVAGPAATTNGGFVLLINGAASTIDAETRSLLEDLELEDTYILGSASSVSSGIENSLRNGPWTVTRVSGPDRYRTALEVNNRFTNSLKVFVATGVSFPDALGGGAVAGSMGGSLYLTQPTCLMPFISDRITGFEGLDPYIFGSEQTLSAAVQNGQLCP